jgi:hypothetical protein
MEKINLPIEWLHILLNSKRGLKVTTLTSQLMEGSKAGERVD